jgi:hypothetical protein
MIRPRTSDKHFLRLLLSASTLLVFAGTVSASSSSETSKIRAVQVRPVPTPSPVPEGTYLAPALTITTSPSWLAPVAPEVGESYCEDAPDLECYPLTDGWPGCCLVNEGADCPEERPACEDNGSDFPSSTPSMVPTSSGGGAPSLLPTREVGTSYCAWAPDTACYPETNGWPACCAENPENCPEEREPCNGTTSLAPAPVVPTAPSVTPAPVPAPSPSPTASTAGTTSGGASVAARLWSSTLGWALLILLPSLL